MARPLPLLRRDEMTKATWLGEKDTPDLKETERFGIKFEKGKAVEIERQEYAEKLANNPNFKVEGLEEKEPSDPLTFTPPSQQSAQGPVPKGGEPVRPTEAKPPGPEVEPPERKIEPAKSTEVPKVSSGAGASVGTSKPAPRRT